MIKSKFFIKLITLFITFFLYYPSLKSNNLINDQNVQKNLKIFSKNSEYLLGAGDKLFLRFFGAKDFSGEVDILNDGTISVPIIGDVFISGMTKKMAEEKIEELLKPHLIQKDVQILIMNPREIKIAVLGEVINPGIYSMTEDEISYTTLENIYNPIKNKGVPTLVDAIQKSGGFTNKASINNIIIKRKMASNDDKDLYEYAFSNLLDLITKGDFNQNLVLFDGDVITVKENMNIENQPIRYFGNLSPLKIDVFVVGEVNKPGLVQISSTSPLPKAILAAGGPKNFRAKKNSIKILRESATGSYTIKEYKFDLKNPLKRNKYPALSQGDVIFVDATNLTKTGDALSNFTAPFFNLNQGLNFIRLINGKDYSD